MSVATACPFARPLQPRSLQLLLLSVLLGSLVAVGSAADATFTLFDNGDSYGGVDVTLRDDEFPVASTAELNAAPAGELFAVKMSRYINVTKYSFPLGTVVATKAFREDGERIQSFDQLLPDDDGNKRRVYLVAEGLEFVWPFIEEGHRQVVSPRALPPLNPDKPVILESISESPRVFKVYNMFSQEEAQAIIDNALSLTGDKAIKRSTVGNSKDKQNDGAKVESGRTSENAWDSSSPTARKMISRSFNLTGIVEDDGQIDGLQIVRYLPGQFYNSHPDYFEKIKGDDFDFNPYSGGSNRFATVFMYLNDVEEGGCTVFPKVHTRVETEPSEAARELLGEDGREWYLTKECHRKLVVPPELGTAALFYSITPDGRIDPRSMHGACPVIKGIKWGANIWIWNRQRYGAIKTGDPRSLTLKNTLDETVYISWEGNDNGAIPPQGTYRLNTFEFHRFKAHTDSHNGDTFAEFTVQSKPDQQEWVILPPRVHSIPDVNDAGDETCESNLSKAER